MGGMRHGFVAAVVFMLVAGLVPCERTATRTSFRINRRRFYNVFVDMAVVHEMEMAVVEIIGMSGVPDLGVEHAGPCSCVCSRCIECSIGKVYPKTGLGPYGLLPPCRPSTALRVTRGFPTGAMLLERG